MRLWLCYSHYSGRVGICKCMHGFWKANVRSNIIRASTRRGVYYTEEPLLQCRDREQTVLRHAPGYMLVCLTRKGYFTRTYYYCVDNCTMFYRLIISREALFPPKAEMVWFLYSLNIVWRLWSKCDNIVCIYICIPI